MAVKTVMPCPLGVLFPQESTPVGTTSPGQTIKVQGTIIEDCYKKNHLNHQLHPRNLSILHTGN